MVLPADTGEQTFGFKWEWGEEGKCSALGATLLQQRAEQLGRKVQVWPLQPDKPAPLTRDERTQLIAAKLSVEAEVGELKERGLALHRQVAALQTQITTLTVQKREADAQVKDARGEALALRQRVEELEAENAELVTERDRLRHLEAIVAGLNEGQPLPGEPPIVVEGGAAR